MLEDLHVRPRISARIRSGALGSCIDDFVVALRRDRYRPGVIRRYVHAAAQFGVWLQRHHHDIADIDDVLLARFIAHLKRRPSASRPGGRLPTVAHGARRVGTFLWATGRALRRSPVATEQDRCLRSFDEYLAGVHGAATGTRRIYLRYARRFLMHHFGTDVPRWSAVTASSIAAFVRDAAAPLSRSSCRGPVSAVRTWLRFLVPRWTLQKRQLIDVSKPTIT